jgi:hypothetical protein
MRSLTLIAVAASLAAVAAAPASAERYRYKRDEYRDQSRNHVTRHHRRLIESAEHDRAQNCDPAGQYAAYPDWARSAFSCGSGRR